MPTALLALCITLNGRACSEAFCPVFGSLKANSCHMGGENSAPGRIIWNISLFSYIFQFWLINSESLEWGCSFPGRLSTALKLLIYYYQQHIKRRLRRTHNYDITSIFALLFLFLKINIPCLQYIALGFNTSNPTQALWNVKTKRKIT